MNQLSFAVEKEIDLNNLPHPDCKACPLKDRPFVPTEIPVNTPQVWIVGEAPGVTESIQKKPFIGKAGKLLRTCLSQIGWDLDTLITNACLCHPEDNKPPAKEAINVCKWHFDKILAKFGKPDLIIALGRTACRALSVNIEKLDNARGKLFDSPYGKVFVTYHPSRIVRSEYKLKALFSFDLKKALLTAKDLVTKTTSYELNTLFNEQEIIDALVEIQKLPSDEPITVDFETALPDSEGNWPEWGLDFTHPLNGIYIAGFAYGNKCISFPVEDKTANTELTKVKQVLKETIKSKSLIAHNSKFESLMSIIHLDVTPKIFHDTQLLTYLINETMQGFYGLKTLVGMFVPEFDGYEKIKTKNVYEYNALDCLCTLRLYDVLMKQMSSLSEKKLLLNAERFILDVINPVLIEMELNGFRVNEAILTATKNNCKEILNLLEAKFESLIQLKNHNSKAFKDALAEMLSNYGIKIPKSETNQFSITRSFIEEVFPKVKNPIIKQLLTYKITASKIEKLYTSYLIPYEKMRSIYTGKIHAMYSSTGTVTGRISSKKPNFQQIPRSGFFVCKTCNCIAQESCPLCGGTDFQEIIKIDELIEPEENHSLVNIDYSQMEVRILAHVSKDPNLIHAIKNGLDLHSYTAGKIYNIPYEEIVNKKDQKDIKAMRQSAKSVTFGIIYGQTAQGLAQRLKCSVNNAQEIIDGFFKTYPAVKEWIEQVHSLVATYKKISTPIGRTRHFDLITAKELREAQNFVIQSFASDVAITGAKFVLDYLKDTNYGRIIGFVHDAIKIEIKNDCLDSALKNIEHLLTDKTQSHYQLVVPLAVDIKKSKGKNNN